MAAAIAIGTAVAALTLFGVQALMADAAESSTPVTSGPAPVLLLAGTMAALLFSAAVAWHLLAPIDSYYRRGGLAMVSAFGTFVMAVLATPLHHFFGAPALLALAAVAGTAGFLLARERRPAERG
ncbi:MAG TPA: hypothetical protein VEB59_10745 [Gemmatimonadales bacterium]|nr:hypothetical protein [Gemmatimonadales bacterium]